jgi:excisionase family DNA binding protein
MQRDTPPAGSLFVGIPQAAALLGCGRTTVYTLVKSGALRTVHIGRRTLIHVDELRRFADELVAEASE